MRKAKILLAFFLTACLMLSIIPLAAFSAVAAAPVADCTVTVQELNVDTADYCVAAYVTFESDTEFTAGTFTVEAAGMTLTDCAGLQSVGGEAPEIDANYAQNTILFTGFSDSTENDFRSYSKLTLSLKFTVEGGFSAIPSGAALTVAVEDVIIGNVDGQRYSTADAEGTVIHVVGGEPGDYAGPEIDPETGEVIAPAHYHTGGTATCHSKAVCTVCGEEYGEFDANNHDGGTEVRDAVEATATEDGYTGDTYCLGCGVKIAEGNVIPATGGGQPVHTPGDINGDGEVDNKDLTRLFQHLSNWDVEVNEPALDVNGDGSVDNKDLTRLFQHLSNWDVEIF